MKEIDRILDREGTWADYFFEHYFNGSYAENLISPKNN